MHLNAVQVSQYILSQLSVSLVCGSENEGTLTSHLTQAAKSHRYHKSPRSPCRALHQLHNCNQAEDTQQYRIWRKRWGIVIQGGRYWTFGCHLTAVDVACHG
jgi:hypothetical protein